MNFSLNIKYTFSEPQTTKEQSHIFVREYVGCSLWWHWWMSNWTWWLCWGRVTFQMRTAYGRNFRFPCFWVCCRCNMHANLFDIHHKRVIILGLWYVFICFASELAFVYTLRFLSYVLVLLYVLFAKFSLIFQYTHWFYP